MLNVNLKDKIFVKLGVSALFLVCAHISCATSGKDPREKSRHPKSEIAKRILKTQNQNEIDPAVLRVRMGIFKEVLKRGGPKNLAAWRLHDDLLTSYIQLKKNHELGINQLRIDPRSKVTLRLPSFCLNSSRAGPEAQERFRWTKNATDIPYYSQLIEYSARNFKQQQEIQELIWNLGNKTRWEEYPENLKEILEKIDPHASRKLPSRLKDRLTEAAGNIISDQLSGAEDIQNAASLIQGAYYGFNEIRRGVENLKSSEPLEPAADDLEEIPETPLLAETESIGFSQQEVTFYNPTDAPVTLDLKNYHLEPLRSDVQRIGLFQPEEKTDDLLSQLEELLYGGMLRLGIGFTPVLNDVADIYELLTGKEFVNGEPLSWGGRLLSGIGLIAGSGAGFRYVERALFAPEKYVSEFEKGFANIARRELELKGLSRAETERVAEAAHTAAENIRKSPTLDKLYSNPAFKKTDFYVRPEGDVIPSKGFRYLKDDTSQVKELMRDGKISANQKDTYISFQKFDDSSKAVDRLQLPPENNARYRVEFDTGSIVNDLKIPRGKWGEADWLEPITKDYPAHGAGGATQAITHSSIPIREIKDLRTGGILYHGK